MAPKTANLGFTLAELLIALALLGIIAAFTIPKVLQASAEQDRVARLRETVSSLEQAWYNARATNSVYMVGTAVTFYDTAAPRLNTVSSGTNLPNADGWVDTPCATFPGYVVFQNGVLVSGLGAGAYFPANLVSPTPVVNTLFCVDITGDAGPNEFGQDAFVGDFNPWGDFDVNQGAVYQPTENGKNFHWGNASEEVYNLAGDPISDALPLLADPQVRVGYWLTR